MASAPLPGQRVPGYRPEIDGLRALAIAPVVVHHAAPALLPGGFVGVDVFFVISGYLITGIVLRELAEGRFSLLRFWERRARRIVPALAAMLAGTSLAAWALLAPEDFTEYAKALIAASAFAANIRFAQGTGYFDGVEATLPLLHTWTLGVEEQFYLVFPLMLLGAWRWRGSGAVLPLIAVTGLASFALALWLAPHAPLLTFYLLPTRMWELMLGAGLAALPRSPRPDGRLAAAGLALLAAGFAVIDPEAPAPGALFLLPTLGTALVLLFADGANRAGQMLAWPVLRWLGLISFGLYLWHQPVLSLARYVHYGPLPALAVVAAVGVSVVLAAASFAMLEQPVRRRRRLAAPAPLFAACAAALAIPFVLGFAGRAGAVLPLSGVEAQRLGGLKPDVARETEVIPPGALGFVLYGDSHAGQYYAAAAERFGPGALLSNNGCLAADSLLNWPPQDGRATECAAMPDRLVELVRERRIPTVLWAQRWDRTLFDSASGARLGDSSAEGGPALEAAMARTLARLPQGTRLIVLGNSPTGWVAGGALQGGWLRCAAYVNVACADSYPAALAEGRTVNARLRAYAARDRQVDYVDIASALCRDARCLLIQDGTLNYWDGSHVTGAGAARAMALIDRALVGNPAPVLP